MTDLLLTRFNYGPKEVFHPCGGTFGTIELPSGLTLFTVERPWLGNKPFVSCVPTGQYGLKRRRSPKVKMITDGRWETGFEITNVHGRSLVMLHPANWPDELNGCVGVGMAYGILNGRLGVERSQDAFDLLMMNLQDDFYTLTITDQILEYP